MKLVCGSSELGEALKVVTRAIGQRTSLPILYNVLLRAEGERLMLACTDLDIGIHTSIPANVREPGMVTVPAKQLQEIVSTLPDDRLTMTAKELDDEDRPENDALSTHHLYLQLRRSKYKLPGLDANQMPWLPALVEHARFRIPQQALKAMVGIVMPCISTNDTRPQMCSAILETTGTRAVLAATDTHRLGVYESPIVDFAAEGEYSGQAILPRRMLQEIQHLSAGANEGMIQVRVDASHIQVEFPEGKIGPIHLVGRQMECNYPPYKRLLRDGCNLMISFDRLELAQALKRVVIVARDNAHQVNLTIEEELMRIDALSTAGEAHEEIAFQIESKEAEVLTFPLQIGFNCAYLLDITASFEGERIRFNILQPDKALLFRPSNNNDYVGVAMPLVFIDMLSALDAKNK